MNNAPDLTIFIAVGFSQRINSNKQNGFSHKSTACTQAQECHALSQLSRYGSLLQSVTIGTVRQSSIIDKYLLLQKL